MYTFIIHLPQNPLDLQPCRVTYLPMNLVLSPASITSDVTLDTCCSVSFLRHGKRIGTRIRCLPFWIQKSILHDDNDATPDGLSLPHGVVAVREWYPLPAAYCGDPQGTHELGETSGSNARIGPATLSTGFQSLGRRWSWNGIVL